MKIYKTVEHLDVVGSDISGSKFDDVNFSGASFDNVNMSGWRVDNVNLAGLRITNANMAGAAVFKARMTSMTIDGILVSDLLAAYDASRRQSPKPSDD